MERVSSSKKITKVALFEAEESNHLAQLMQCWRERHPEAEIVGTPDIKVVQDIAGQGNGLHTPFASEGAWNLDTTFPYRATIMFVEDEHAKQGPKVALLGKGHFSEFSL